jgi:hypothetical protein
VKKALPFVFAAVVILAAASPLHLSAAQESRIQIIPGPDSVGPATRLTVLIADGGLNGNAGRIDEYEADDVELVTFRTDRSELGEASPDLEETGKSTGVFAFTIQLETDDESCDDDRFTSPRFYAVGGSDPSIGACPGDILSISYEDFHTASGGEEVISLSVQIKSWDPDFTADRDSYHLEGRVIVDIFDPDADRDPDIADSLRNIRVTSDSDAVGEEFSALETGDNTGVFRLTFTISLQGQGNTILVGDGDDMQVQYTDEFPADFDSEEKTFTFTMLAGYIEDGIPLLMSSAPKVATNGTPAAGKQAMLSVVITNNSNNRQTFLQLVEVRDSSGTTAFLAWQGSTIEPHGLTEIGFSWTPDEPDDYEIRTFAISDLENPLVFSLVSTTEVTIP